MKKPKTENSQYWDENRFRYLFYIEKLEEYIKYIEKKLKYETNQTSTDIKNNRRDKKFS